MGEKNTDKKKYRRLVKKEKKIPLFSKDWWLDIFCGEENWNVFLIEKDNKILGALPYYIKLQEKKIQKAPFSQNAYLYINYPLNISQEKKKRITQKINEEIIKKIENLNLLEYRQYFHWSYKFWLPFYWKGYSQTTRYTYRIDTKKKIEEINKNFNSNVRNYIKKSSKIVEIHEGLEIKKFYKLCNDTFKRQGLITPYTYNQILNLYKKTQELKNGKILYAIDKNENIHSAIFVVWDNDSLYYLFSGSNIEFRSSQSLTLLIYEGIKLAKELDKIFDFEGSMKKNIEYSFSQFGGELVPYYDISKDYNERRNNNEKL